jgi:hypothetical protein
LEGSPKQVGTARMFGELGSGHLAIGTAGSKRRFLLRWTRLLEDWGLTLSLLERG